MCLDFTGVGLSSRKSRSDQHCIGGGGASFQALTSSFPKQNSINLLTMLDMATAAMSCVI